MPKPFLPLPDSCARCGSQIERPGLYYCDFCRPEAPSSSACAANSFAQAAAMLLPSSVAPAAVAEAPAAERRDLPQSPEQAEVALQMALQSLRLKHPELVHPDQAAVRRFAHAMEAKMAVSRTKGRFGWDSPELCPTSYLQQSLQEHLRKGDPVDVANFCMMLWDRRAKVVA